MKRPKKIRSARHDRDRGRVEVDAWVFDEADGLAVEKNANYAGGWTILHLRTGFCFSGIVTEPTRSRAVRQLESILALGVDWDFGKFGVLPDRRNRKWARARLAVQQWITDQETQ